MNYLKIASHAVAEQSKALTLLSSNIPADFPVLVEYILNLKGRIILTGMGKSGYIARKIAASLASTGTPAFYIHPSEASHGDLGMITETDMVLMLSNSGETKELLDTLTYCKRFNIKIASITMKENSTLGQSSDFLLKLPAQGETSSISAPTTSALMSLAIGDALVTVLHEAKGFTTDDFRLFHPGGKIGSNLLKVSDLMHKGDALPIVYENTDFADVIVTITKKRLGCSLVVDSNGKAIGIITDGDLRRHLVSQLNDIKAVDVMTESPSCIKSDSLASEALMLMNKKEITALPVEQEGTLVGIIHIHDILKAGVV